MTSTERTQEFRRRNPDYNRLYKIRRRAALEAMYGTKAPAKALAKAEAPVAMFQPHKQLALPAPVAPLFVIPTLAEVRERAAMAAARPTTHTSRTR
ncbi:MAG TPA: hypothetical protein VGN72_09220 [Tepidisphaeraceae bacterium]|jgi:hypothetical protein|nr:hypothetical protein [Tepidisphaeraceae bacterium]